MDPNEHENNNEETPVEEQQAPEEHSQEEEQQEVEEERNDDEPIEDRLKRTEDELTRVREEAAAKRVANRELKEQLKNAKTEDDIKAAVAEYEDKVATLERQILVRDVADAVGLPAALRDRLKGETKEELEADAKALAALVPKGRTFDEDDIRGGLDPSDDVDDSEDISKAVARARRGR